MAQHDQHLLAYKSNNETKAIYSLSLRQAAWWGLGIFLSYKLISIFPAIPYIKFYGYVPHISPFLIALLFAHFKHPATNWYLSTFIINYIKCKFRRKVYTN